MDRSESKSCIRDSATKQLFIGAKFCVGTCRVWQEETRDVYL